jgi:hypothetical protein
MNRTNITKKIVLTISGFMILGSTVGCGLKRSNPLDPYKTLVVVPENDPRGMSTEKVQYVVIENNKNVLTEVDNKDPRTTDGAGQVALQNALFQVSYPENISFIEEQENSFEMTIKFLKGEVKFDIEAQIVPDANFKIEPLSQEINISKYKVSWIAPKDKIEAGKLSLLSSFQIALKDITYLSADEKIKEDTKKAYESLFLKTVEVPFVIRKNQDMPKLVVNNLDKNLNSGEVHKFSVDITAPSSYSTNEPLVPEVFYDLVNIVNAQGLVDANGAYFVSIDPDKNTVEKLSANKWRVHYIFDTKNIDMLPQFDKSLHVVENPEKLNVSVSFRVNSDKVAVSEKKTIRLAIHLK